MSSPVPSPTAQALSPGGQASGSAASPTPPDRLA
eukprot:CAMPEP_0198574570 /NCGR_PEP_ID=MMETSP1462-20131121/114862_1 /TAXON_ID=1333877 /ORGANISM="Brandtodinium nutriculum, Strain RCC3387" /LENGTH=33 /DNA_ID= /DNA_START= /DNA_END= /DNA_ORIENTATION=